MRFLLTRRWIALTLICLLLLPAFKALSDWQWRRLHQRQAWNSLITGNEARPPLAIADLPTTLDAASQWRLVKACGTWDVDNQVLVRRKSFQARAGFWVATPLRTDAGDFVVVRGWIAAGDSSLDTPTVPLPPTSRVCTVSRLRLAPTDAKPTPSDVPRGQVDALVPTRLLASAYSAGYGELESSEPASSAGLIMLPAPELTEGPHRSYALQWLLFAIMVVIGWVVLVRAEVQRSSEEN